MDRIWIYDASRVSAKYKNGVNYFLVQAVMHKSNTQSQYICYPCVDCENKKQFSTIQQIHSHLMPRGFMSSYTCWTEHGEAEIVQEGQYIEREDEDMCTDMPVNKYIDMPPAGDTLADDDLDEMLADADIDDLEQMLRDGEGNFTNEREFQKFQRMVEDSKTPGLREGAYKVAYHAFTVAIEGKQRVIWYKLHRVVTILEEIASKGKYAARKYVPG